MLVLGEDAHAKSTSASDVIAREVGEDHLGHIRRDELLDRARHRGLRIRREILGKERQHAWKLIKDRRTLLPDPEAFLLFR